MALLPPAPAAAAPGAAPGVVNDVVGAGNPAGAVVQWAAAAAAGTCFPHLSVGGRNSTWVMLIHRVRIAY